MTNLLKHLDKHLKNILTNLLKHLDKHLKNILTNLLKHLDKHLKNILTNIFKHLTRAVAGLILLVGAIKAMRIFLDRSYKKNALYINSSAEYISSHALLENIAQIYAPINSFENI